LAGASFSKQLQGLNGLFFSKPDLGSIDLEDGDLGDGASGGWGDDGAR
jgi:hypothetical protein